VTNREKSLKTCRDYSGDHCNPGWPFSIALVQDRFNDHQREYGECNWAKYICNPSKGGQSGRYSCFIGFPKAKEIFLLNKARFGLLLFHSRKVFICENIRPKKYLS